MQEIIKFNEQLSNGVNTYLEKNEETSQFLINNLVTYGPNLTEHHNSGNYQVILESGKIIGVFCLTRRGNLLIQAESQTNLDGVLESCLTEPQELKGFIGPWNISESAYKKYSKINPDYKPSFNSREILYSYELDPKNKLFSHDRKVRLLEAEDFEQWLSLNTAYCEELKTPVDITKEQKKNDFLSKVKQKAWWGYFEDSELISITALNSNGRRIGQVGGVYTKVKNRKQGIAKVMMFHMLKDCIDIHKHTKNILFTREEDSNPARKLYESMGYKNSGDFGLILG